MKRTLLWLLCAFLVTTTATALADAASAEAEALFAQGAKAYQEGRYEDAVDAFLAAYEKDPQPLLFYNVAQAYERLGRRAQCARALTAITCDTSQTSRTAPSSRRASATSRSVCAHKASSRYRFSPHRAAPRCCSIVKKSARRLGRVEARPGRHSVVLRLSGHADAKKQLVLGPDRAVDLDVALVPLVFCIAQRDGQNGNTTLKVRFDAGRSRRRAGDSNRGLGRRSASALPRSAARSSSSCCAAGPKATPKRPTHKSNTSITLRPCNLARR